MGDNRGTLAKRLKDRVKISRGSYKPRVWSLDPTDHGLTGPHCIFSHDKNLPNPKKILYVSFKVPNVKTSYDHDDLENKVKVKLRIQ